MTAMRERLRRILIALGLGFGLAMVPTVVFAASDEPPPVGLDAGADALFSIDASIVAVLLGTVIPILNGLVTKLSTGSGVKAILTLALSTIAGLIVTATTDGGDAVFSSALVLNTALTFIVAVATYAGLWKPLAVTSSPKSDGTPGTLANIGVK